MWQRQKIRDYAGSYRAFPYSLKTMLKKVASIVTLLSTAIVISSYSQAAIATPATPDIIPQAIAQTQTASTAKLTLEDLPPGFQALPPQFATFLAAQLDAFKPQMEAANIQPENFFAFFNRKNLEFVVGLTGNIPNQQQGKFDASLQKVQEPEAQQELISRVQQKLKAFGMIEFVEYNTLPDVNNLANASSGLRVGLKIQDQPLQMDVAGFRRNNVGAFTAVIYLNDKTPTLSLKEVADKLDRRILQSSPSGKLSRSN